MEADKLAKVEKLVNSMLYDLFPALLQRVETLEKTVSEQEVRINKLKGNVNTSRARKNYVTYTMIKKLYDEGNSDRAISKITKVPYSTVRSYRAMSPEQVAELLRQHKLELEWSKKRAAGL